jgi:protein SCO1
VKAALVVIGLGLGLGLGLETVRADAPVGSPAWAEGADVTEHLGAKLPLDLAFTDSAGQPRHLRDAFDGTHPVLLVLAYYECPQLCTMVLEGAAAAIAQLDHYGFALGTQYKAVTISFDATERPIQALKKQTAVLAALPAATAQRWPFWVGDDAAVTALTSALGYRFLRDPRTGTLAHAAVVFVLTPDGTISRYLYGTDYPPRDLKLALLEASDGKTGSVGDKILLRCFHYDAATRRYGVFISRFLAIGGALIALVVAAVLALLWRFDRRREHAP